MSAISYDPAHQLYYVISDDKSKYNAAQFYTVRIPHSGRGIDALDFVATRPWLDPAGLPFGAQYLDVDPPVLPPDPEGVAFDGSRQRLYWSSEGKWEPGRDGKPAFVLNPWVRIAGLDGSHQGEFAMPPGFSMSPRATPVQNPISRLRVSRCRLRFRRRPADNPREMNHQRCVAAGVDTNETYCHGRQYTLTGR